MEEYPFIPPTPMPEPTPEQLEGWRKAFEEGRPRHLFPVTITGPALHDTQIRAYALMAAANLPHPNLRPSPVDVAQWREAVIALAEKFAAYVEHGPDRRPKLRDKVNPDNL